MAPAVLTTTTTPKRPRATCRTPCPARAGRRPVRESRSVGTRFGIRYDLLHDLELRPRASLRRLLAHLRSGERDSLVPHVRARRHARRPLRPRARAPAARARPRLERPHDLALPRDPARRPRGTPRAARGRADAPGASQPRAPSGAAHARDRERRRATPDGLVQGSRDGGRGRARPRAREQGDPRRLDRECGRVARGPRGLVRDPVDHPRPQDGASAQARPAHDLRGAPGADRRRLRRLLRSLHARGARARLRPPLDGRQSVHDRGQEDLLARAGRAARLGRPRARRGLGGRRLHHCRSLQRVQRSARDRPDLAHSLA